MKLLLLKLAQGKNGFIFLDSSAPAAHRGNTKYEFLK